MHKRHIICLLGILLFAINLPAQVHKPQKKAVIRTEAHYVFDQEDEGNTIDTVKLWCARYNRNGDEIWDTTYDIKKVTNYTRNRYNKKGIITRSVTKQYSYDDNKKSEFISYTYYDVYGNEISERDYNEGRLASITQIKRDTNENILREDILEPDSTLTYFITCTYDKINRTEIDSNVTSRTDSARHKHFFSAAVITYYKNIYGDDSIIMNHDRMRGFSTKTMNIYTPEGWLAEHIVRNIDRDTTEIKDVYTYNSKGQLVKAVKFDLYPPHTDTITYKYNRNGDCTEENNNGYIQKNIYTYYRQSR